MDYYINITVLPDAEFSQNILLGSLYTKLHKVLSDMDSTHIGVSFPKYACDLGALLRIHGEENVLNDLQGRNWLGGMSGSRVALPRERFSPSLD